MKRKKQQNNINKTIDEFFSRVGFTKRSPEDDVYSFLCRKAGMQYAERISDYIEGRSDYGENSDYEFYTYKNKDLDCSLALSNCLQDQIIRNFAKWIWKNRNYMKGYILDVGCDNGLLTCLLAYIFP